MVDTGAGDPSVTVEDSNVSAGPAREAPVGVDVLSQALKALSYLPPFDADSSAPRVPPLPSGLSSFLIRSSEGHKKHKKLHGESAEKPSGRGKLVTLWDETEDYFRPVTLVDIDMLVSKLCLDSSLLRSCLSMPQIGNGTVARNRDSDSDAAGVELSSISLPKKAELSLEHQDKEMMSVQVAEKVQPTEIDEDVAPSDNTSPTRGNDNRLSLHWLLESKGRIVLTSERPNKKRKLLGRDAGLDRLLILPNSPSGAPLCDFCCSAESSSKSNKLLCCHSCKVFVHQKCYGVHNLPEGLWLCTWCKHLETAGKLSERDGQVLSVGSCLLCPREGGALKMVKRVSSLDLSNATTKYVHLFCSLWTPEVYVEDAGTMNLVLSTKGIDDTRQRLVCNVCKVKHGVCIRCSHGTCRTSFHPMCARELNHRMEIWGRFGCDNVELRAFCPKHSTSQDLSSNEGPSYHMMAFNDQSSKNQPITTVLPTKKFPKFLFTRKNRNKTMVQNEITNSDSENITQMEPDMEQNALACMLSSECNQAGRDAEMNFAGFNRDITNNTVDVTAILRKLIDHGKVNADEVASVMGISLDSFQAALVGETTSFSPGLKMKLIKWLRSYAHMSRFQSSKDGSSSVISSDSKVINVDRFKSPEEKDPENHQASDYFTSELSDAELVKSLPPQGGTCDTRILNNEAPLYSGGVENGNQKIVDETNETPVILNEVGKGDIIGEKHSHPLKGFPNEQNLQEMHIIEAVFKTGVSILPSAPCQGQTQTPLSTIGLSEEEYKTNDTQENVSSLGCDRNHADYDNSIISHDLKNGHKIFDGGDPVFSSKSYDKNAGLLAVSNIHPLIKKKLLHMQKNASLKDNSRLFNVPLEKLVLPTLAPTRACPSCSPQCLPCSCAEKHTVDRTSVDQLSNAKRRPFLELSPEDEIEGEMLYLQARLLDKNVVIKHCSEDLLLKIVTNIPFELNASNKHKWDLILVSQYLREVREAKKQGRKERKHKEAQAVLASATAAAAASSRHSLRKDSYEETMATQEGPAKSNHAPARIGLQTTSVHMAQEVFRSSVSKLSSDTDSLAFQMPDFLKDNALFCEICMRTETILNRIFVCSSCKVSVHLDCYLSVKNPIGSWKCELCEDLLLSSLSSKSQCGLCGGVNGAMRKCKDGQWVHSLCAEWLLKSSFRRGQENLVEAMDTVLKGKDICCVCNTNTGACLKCSNGQCPYTFHPSCARAAGFYMNAKFTSGCLDHKAYCGRHSIEQREADNQQCSVEDLKRLTQIRVELEKLRLLCERIIKREKLKKELVLCSHDLLASRRDCVAYSMFIRSSFFPLRDSSESATTSINSRSYSGTVQRSDEITVDSTVSGKRATKPSLNRDFDRNTDDSSTSQLSCKRKLTNRGFLAGKQLPLESTSMAFQKSTEDGEKKAKTRKSETFQKEVMMTSDQASMQNQRLPKGFFYVPVGSLSKEKPLTQDLDPFQPRESGG